MNFDKLVSLITESSATIPKILYHATYRPLLRSIKKHGLDPQKGKSKWSDSKRDRIYLSIDPYVAESYAESSEEVNEEWLDEIIILQINVNLLDEERFDVDSNVLENDGTTLSYVGVIPPKAISIFKTDTILEKKETLNVPKSDDLKEIMHEENSVTRTFWHVTPTKNLRSIKKIGLQPRIGNRSTQLDEPEAVFLFNSLEDAKEAVMNWLGDEFDEDEPLTMLRITIPANTNIQISYDGLSSYTYDIIPLQYIEKENIEI